MIPGPENPSTGVIHSADEKACALSAVRLAKTSAIASCPARSILTQGTRHFRQ